MEHNVMVILGVPHTKNQLPRQKNCGLQAHFLAHFDFSTKPEVVFKKKKGNRSHLTTLQTPYWQNLKSLCGLVRSKGFFETKN